MATGRKAAVKTSHDAGGASLADGLIGLNERQLQHSELKSPRKADVL